MVRNLFQGEIGEENLWMKNKSFYYLFIQHIKTAQRSWFSWECLHMQGQAALTECVWFIIVYCFFTIGSVKFLQLSLLQFLLERN